MAQARSYESDIKAAASDVMNECPHALPPVTELMSKFTAIDQHRDQLLRMMQASSRYMENMITPLQHRLLLEFTAVQAAKACIEQEELLDEICVRYNLMDAQELTIRDFWEALNFSWHYAEGKL